MCLTSMPELQQLARSNKQPGTRSSSRVIRGWPRRSDTPATWHLAGPSNADSRCPTQSRNRFMAQSESPRDHRHARSTYFSSRYLRSALLGDELDHDNNQACQPQRPVGFPSIHGPTSERERGSRNAAVPASSEIAARGRRRASRSVRGWLVSGSGSTPVEKVDDCIQGGGNCRSC